MSPAKIIPTPIDDASSSYDQEIAERSIVPLSDNREEKRSSIRFNNVDVDGVVNALNIEFVNTTVYNFLGDNEKTVTGLFQGDFDEILVLLKLYLDCDVLSVGNSRFFVNKSSSYKDLEYKYSFESDLPEETIKQLSLSYNVNIYNNLTKFVATGNYYDLKSFDESLNLLEGPSQNYIVKLVFVRVRETDLARLQAEIESNKIDLFARNIDWRTLFSASFDLKFSDLKDSDRTIQTLYCSDGSASSIKIGSQRTRENRTLSDYGVSSVSGYQNFNDGISFEITPRRLSGDNVELALTFQKSKFTSDTDLSKTQVDLDYKSIKVKSGKPYYITSYKEENNSFVTTIVGGQKSNAKEVTAVFVVVKPVI